MAIIDDYINSIKQKLTKLSQEQRNIGLKSMANRGVIGSAGIELDYEKQIEEAFNQRLSEVIPTAMMEDRQFQEQVNQFRQQMQNRRANQSLVASQNEQQLGLSKQEFGERTREFNINNKLREREIANQEREIQARLDAQERQNSNWWQPILGTAIGTFTGGVGGNLASRAVTGLLGNTVPGVTQSADGSPTYDYLTLPISQEDNANYNIQQNIQNPYMPNRPQQLDWYSPLITQNSIQHQNQLYPNISDYDTYRSRANWKYPGR